MTPGEVRAMARRQRRAPDSGIELRLPCRAPLDGDGLIAFLAARAVPGIEAVTEGAYRRSLRLPHGAGTVELRPAERHVQARYWLDDLRDLAAGVQRSRALLDLDSDPEAVAEILGGDSLLGPFVRATPGRRVAGCTDGDELAIRAVLGQQVSLAAAATLAGRLVRAYGQPLERPLGTVTHLFPSADELAAADLAPLGMPRRRSDALCGLARALADGALVLDAGADREEARRRLLALPGIGPWSAGYVAMRALRDPDAFLPGDLGVRHALEELGQDGSPAAAARIADRWRPYRAYAVQHLWALLQAAAGAPAKRQLDRLAA